MNLVNEQWLHAESGAILKIRPAECVDPAVTDLASPRADFRGAGFQFLIGLLQLAYAPKTHDQWADLYNSPPSEGDLDQAFAKVAKYFDLQAPIGQAAFMQDLLLSGCEPKPVASLLIESPGDNTVKNNSDFFVKRGGANSLCQCCAAQALFTLQINAPAGGQGYRVGLRGGGPLTTLLLPAGHSSLWQKLWLNVLPQTVLPPATDIELGTTLPWLAETRISSDKGSETLPEHMHGLHAYWGMPRRIRLETPSTHGECNVCGVESAALITHYSTRNYGYNYDGPWQHPLTPYKHDVKKVKPPLSLKAQPNGLGYRHWQALVIGNQATGEMPALVVADYINQKAEALAMLGDESDIRLWAFGFDMDNMKPRCWYESEIPLLHCDESQREMLVDACGQLVAAAKDIVATVRKQIKAAWSRRPADMKGDTSFIDQTFWAATEADFYRCLTLVMNNAGELNAEVSSCWHTALSRSAEQVFEQYVIASDSDELQMQRVISARLDLQRFVYGNKHMKNFAKQAKNKTTGA